MTSTAKKHDRIDGNDTHHLNDEQKRIAEKILAVAKTYTSADTGGCRTFYTPSEWKKRGEDYGLNSKLIVVHDGGELAPFFSYDYEAYGWIETMRAALEGIGYYYEACTCWYGAIYRA